MFHQNAQGDGVFFALFNNGNFKRQNLTIYEQQLVRV